MPEMKRYEGETRKERLKQVPRGPGVFVYDGSAEDHECIPQIKRNKGSEPVLGDDGLPLIGSDGRMVSRPSGTPVLSDDGTPMLGGPPKIKRIPLDTYTLRGVDFPKDQPVKVSDLSLALKCRLMSCLTEVNESEAKGAKSAEKSVPGGSAPVIDADQILKVHWKTAVSMIEDLENVDILRKLYAEDERDSVLQAVVDRMDALGEELEPSEE